MQTILASLLGLALLHALYFFRSLLIPICLALLLYFALSPVVAVFNRLKLPSTAAAAIVVGTLTATLALGIYLLAEPASQWVDRGPQLYYRMEYKLGSVLRTIKKAKTASQKFEDIAEPTGDEHRKIVVEAPSLASQFYSNAKSALFNAGLILVFLYFFLAHGHSTFQRSRAASSCADHESSPLFTIRKAIGHYLSTVCIINAVLGVLTAVLAAVLGMPNAMLWGVVAAVFNFVPYLGSAATLLILGIVSFMTFESWLRMVLPPVGFFVLTALEGQLVTPSLLGRRFMVNPLVVFLAIFFWGWMWGAPGVILAMPILSTVKLISQNIEQLQVVSRFLE